jgi:TBC1 domain family member 5
VSVSEDGNKARYVKAMDLAIAKVEFVKVYLEDAAMPLPEESSQSEAVTPSRMPADTPPPPLHEPLQGPAPDPTVTTSPDPKAEKSNAESVGKPLPYSPTPSNVPDIAASPNTIPSKDLQQITIEPANEGELASRPKAPVPTRSTIAQSSFSWMLEPDSPSGSAMKSSPPKSSSPFLKSGRRPASGSGRERAAFLFGEVEDSQVSSARSQSQSRADTETFNLGAINR